MGVYINCGTTEKRVERDGNVKFKGNEEKSTLDKKHIIRVVIRRLDNDNCS